LLRRLGMMRRKDSDNMLLLQRRGLLKLNFHWHTESRSLAILNLDESISKFIVKKISFKDFSILFVYFNRYFLNLRMNLDVRIEIGLFKRCRLHPNLFRTVTGQTILLLWSVILPHYFYKEDILSLILVNLKMNCVVILGQAAAADRFKCLPLFPE
jgi:hypothetical protein